jgi:hypothetical protein
MISRTHQSWPDGVAIELDNLTVEDNMKYDHMFEIAFTVKSQFCGEAVPASEILDALEARIAELRASCDDNYVLESVGLPIDSYEVQ